MLKEQTRAVEGVARAADLGLIAGSFVMSASISDSRHLHGALAWLPGQGGMHVAISSDQYALLFTFSLLSWIAATQLRGTYTSVRADRSSSIVWNYVMTGMLWALLIGFSAFFFKLQLVSRSFLTVFLPLATLAVGARRTGEQLLMRFIRGKGFNLRDVLVVGDQSRAARLVEFIEHEGSSGYRVVRHVVTHPDRPTECEDTEFDEAFVLMGSGAANFESLVMRFIERGKRVHFVPGIFDARRFRQHLTEFAGIPLLTVGGYGLSLPQRVAKRVFDVAGSLILLVLLAPLFVLIALLVKLSSRGRFSFLRYASARANVSFASINSARCARMPKRFSRQIQHCISGISTITTSSQKARILESQRSEVYSEAPALMSFPSCSMYCGAR